MGHKGRCKNDPVTAVLKCIKEILDENRNPTAGMLEATARLVTTQSDADATGTPELNPVANMEMDVPTLTHPEWQNDI